MQAKNVQKMCFFQKSVGVNGLTYVLTYMAILKSKASKYPVIPAQTRSSQHLTLISEVAIIIEL